MKDRMWHQMVETLEETGVRFDRGLSDTEISGVEATFRFRFPPDLGAFLRAGLPISQGFPNWRDEPEASLQERLSLPLEGILFDIEHNGFWLAEWGSRPSAINEAKAIVSELVAAAPVLIPIYVHRMIPDRPHDYANPVFSVHQTDIICYGCDLRDYIVHEFLSRPELGVWPVSDSVKKIEFWNIDRFQAVRWSRGPVIFDNRRGLLP